MSGKIIPFPERKTPPNFAEFPDGYDAGIIFNALVVYRNDGLYSLVAPVQRVTGYDVVVPLAKLEYQACGAIGKH